MSPVHLINHPVFALPDKSKFGYKMLMKFGWSEGKGLGRNLEGQTSAVKLTKRVDGLGLGANDDKAGNVGWSSTSMSFNSVLATLNDKYGRFLHVMGENHDNDVPTHMIRLVNFTGQGTEDEPDDSKKKKKKKTKKAKASSSSSGEKISVGIK